MNNINNIIKQLNINIIYSVEINNNFTNYNITLLNNKSQLINNYCLKDYNYNKMLNFCLNKSLEYYNIKKSNIETIFYNDIFHLFNQH